MVENHHVWQVSSEIFHKKSTNKTTVLVVVVSTAQTPWQITRFLCPDCGSQEAHFFSWLFVVFETCPHQDVSTTTCKPQNLLRPKRYLVISTGWTPYLGVLKMLKLSRLQPAYSSFWLSRNNVKQLYRPSRLWFPPQHHVIALWSNEESWLRDPHVLSMSSIVGKFWWFWISSIFSVIPLWYHIVKQSFCVASLFLHPNEHSKTSRISFWVPFFIKKNPNVWRVHLRGSRPSSRVWVGWWSGPRRPWPIWSMARSPASAAALKKGWRWKR